MGHLQAARDFAARLNAHEAENKGRGWGPHWDTSRNLATAAIILSFSAIEAAINEAEDDAQIPADLINALEKTSALDHIQALLDHKGQPRIDPGASIHQSAELLRKIRNELVHPRPIWVGEPGRAQKLSKRIVDAKLLLSPFMATPDEAFPLGCMSAGVSKWAVKSATNLIVEFRQRMGLTTLEYSTLLEIV